MNQDFDLESLDFRPVQSNPKLPMKSIILTAIILPLSVFFMLIGSFTIYDCSLEPRLPIWMILLGSFLAIDRGLTWIFELNMYCFQRNNTRPDEEIKVLREWEFKKAGLQLRISNYAPLTFCGLLFL
ncbi:hypothetical protein CRE_07143 [Caenorhabditis remanei]|uniref:Uncharacterized protein n=1 Tax=Caenorhabditis remanei TaxID=31234 RepID=E3NR06_CAERE|nr:hypothetical protein CRE_07143 [Caenorhabditis remanei]